MSSQVLKVSDELSHWADKLNSLYGSMSLRIVLQNCPYETPGRNFPKKNILRSQIIMQMARAVAKQSGMVQILLRIFGYHKSYGQKVFLSNSLDF